MDKRIYFFVLMTLMSIRTQAQVYYQLYYDNKHFQAVTENQAFRMAQELILTDRTDAVKENLNKINQNVAKVVLVKNQIYNSLVNVNEALKDGKELIYITRLVKEIAEESTELGKMAVGNPLFVAFAEKQARSVLTQSVNIFNEVNQYVLKGGNDLLMNYNTRDELLRSLTHRLKLLRAEIFVTWQTIYYAKLNGIWSSLNPFRDYINQDLSIIQDIIWKAKFL